jgi:hypothetical protein
MAGIAGAKPETLSYIRFLTPCKFKLAVAVLSSAVLFAIPFYAQLTETMHTALANLLHIPRLSAKR